MLGPSLTADTGEWGTYAWNEHVLGAPGYRIAGGSDEIQRNIIGERVLGLPGEPRVDRDISFAELARAKPRLTTGRVTGRLTTVLTSGGYSPNQYRVNIRE